MSDDNIRRIEGQLAELYQLARASAERQSEMAIAIARLEERLSSGRSIIVGSWHVIATVVSAVLAVAALFLAYLRK